MPTADSPADSKERLYCGEVTSANSYGSSDGKIGDVRRYEEGFRLPIPSESDGLAVVEVVFVLFFFFDNNSGDSLEREREIELELEGETDNGVETPSSVIVVHSLTPLETPTSYYY